MCHSFSTDSKSTANIRDVVEMGCGYGTFTLPVALRISGVLTTFDIESEMVERTRQRAAQAGVGNVLYVVGDVFADGFGESASKDACLLFNILHCEQPAKLLAEAAQVVRPAGFVYVIHWRYDPATPRGPSMEVRPRPEQIVDWAEEAGLLASPEGVLHLPPWHYGIRFQHVTVTADRNY
jgi:SAM-dependent methyltransferase